MDKFIFKKAIDWMSA